MNIYLIIPAQALPKSIPVNPVAYFQQIATQIQSYKYQIQNCYEMTNAFTECNGGMHNIDHDITTPAKNIALLTTRFGIITVLPVAIDMILPTDSYILTPSVGYHTFSWTASGSAVEKGYVNF